ncbi:hypothetical protein JCM9492_07210 [Aquifex pyrophilus]
MDFKKLALASAIFAFGAIVGCGGDNGGGTPQAEQPSPAPEEPQPQPQLLESILVRLTDSNQAAVLNVSGPGYYKILTYEDGSYEAIPVQLVLLPGETPPQNLETFHIFGNNNLLLKAHAEDSYYYYFYDGNSIVQLSDPQDSDQPLIGVSGTALFKGEKFVVVSDGTDYYMITDQGSVYLLDSEPEVITENYVWDGTAITDIQGNQTTLVDFIYTGEGKGIGIKANDNGDNVLVLVQPDGSIKETSYVFGGSLVGPASGINRYMRVDKENWAYVAFVDDDELKYYKFDLTSQEPLAYIPVHNLIVVEDDGNEINYSGFDSNCATNGATCDYALDDNGNLFLLYYYQVNTSDKTDVVYVSSDGQTIDAYTLDDIYTSFSFVGQDWATIAGTKYIAYFQDGNLTVTERTDLADNVPTFNPGTTIIYDQYVDGDVLYRKGNEVLYISPAADEAWYFSVTLPGPYVHHNKKTYNTNIKVIGFFGNEFIVDPDEDVTENNLDVYKLNIQLPYMTTATLTDIDVYALDTILRPVQGDVYDSNTSSAGYDAIYSKVLVNAEGNDSDSDNYADSNVNVYRVDIDADSKVGPLNPDVFTTSDVHSSVNFRLGNVVAYAYYVQTEDGLRCDPNNGTYSRLRVALNGQLLTEVNFLEEYNLCIADIIGVSNK